MGREVAASVHEPEEVFEFEKVADLDDPACGDDRVRRPPGAAASTVNARPLWIALMRWILHSRCGALNSFCRSALHSHSWEATPPTPRPVWPVPLPYPGRVQGCEAVSNEDAAAWQSCANVMVLLLNWLKLGQPFRWPSRYSAFCPLSQEQDLIVGRLKHLSGEWLLFQDVTAETMGRTAGKVESLEVMVRDLERIATACSPSSGSGKGPSIAARRGEHAVAVEEIQAAKPIEAQRLVFKGKPNFDPTPYLVEPARSLYRRPLDFAVDASECLEDVPAVKARGPRKELLGLLAALDDTSRLALFTPEQIRMGHRAGVFALMKNLEADRLILDCRPANLLEPGLNLWTQTMGSLQPILGLHVPPGHKIVAAGEDLKDYYYYYVITPQRARRNAIAMQLTRAEAKRFRGAYRWADKSAKVLIPALATMAMGDLNSVEFGQQSHVRLGLMHGVVRLSDLLTMRGRIPRQLWSVGYVIDDFICLEAVPLEQRPEDYFSSVVADAMAKVYDDVGLEANSKKRFRAESNPQFWGISVAGHDCLVRGQLDRVIPMCFVTARVARAGVASRHLLEVLAGAWTAIIQSRKRAMCLLDTIFAVIQGHAWTLGGRALDVGWVGSPVL